VTGIPNYPQGRFFDGYGYKRKRKEVVNGVNIYRSFLIPRGKSRIQLILNYFSFVIGGHLSLMRLVKDFDMIFIYEVSPMLQALPGIWYGNKNSIPIKLYVTDLWPQSVEQIGGIRIKWILYILQKISTYIYNHSSEIFVSSKGFISPIASNTVTSKITYLPIYAEKEYSDSYEIKKSINSFRFVFAGNFGQAQGLDVLIKAMSKIDANKLKFSVLMIGDGREKNKLEKLAFDCGLTSKFHFLGSKSVSETIHLVKSCEVGLISLSNNDINKLTIPAKMQSLMAMSMPILAIGEGEIKNTVLSAKCGLAANPLDLDEVADKLLEFVNMKHEELKKFSINARRYYDEYFNENLFFDKLIESMRRTNEG
jgi:glycosyltransferase involved in cell wall biosynthesis